MKKILLVDDDVAMCQALLRLCHKNWPDRLVKAAANGHKALRMLEEEEFDLLITDIMMPGKDGFETIRAVRNRYPGMKIVAISGSGRQSAFDPLGCARKFGAHETLDKPFTFDRLTTVVEKLLNPDLSPTDVES